MLGKEKLYEFIQGRLINSKFGLLNTTNKNNLKTGIKSEKSRKNKIISTLQEACQAFELTVDISLSLAEAFSFPITTVPLSIVVEVRKDIFLKLYHCTKNEVFHYGFLQ